MPVRCHGPSIFFFLVDYINIKHVKIHLYRKDGHDHPKTIEIQLTCNPAHVCLCMPCLSVLLFHIYLFHICNLLYGIRSGWSPGANFFPAQGTGWDGREATRVGVGFGKEKQNQECIRKDWGSGSGKDQKHRAKGEKIGGVIFIDRWGGQKQTKRQTTYVLRL